MYIAKFMCTPHPPSGHPRGGKLHHCSDPPQWPLVCAQTWYTHLVQQNMKWTYKLSVHHKRNKGTWGKLELMELALLG